VTGPAARRDLAGLERRREPGGELGEPGWPLARQRGLGPEHLGQQGVVHLGPPGQPVEAHLGRDEPAGRLGGDQQAEPARMLVGRDQPQLVRVDLDQRVQQVARVRRLGCAGEFGVEQRLLCLPAEPGRRPRASLP
jgi:hypothetical protein